MFWCLSRRHVWHSLAIAPSCHESKVKCDGRRERKESWWKPCTSSTSVRAVWFIGYGHWSVIGVFSLFVRERQYQTPHPPSGSILKDSWSLWKAIWHLTAGQSWGHGVMSQRSGTEAWWESCRKTSASSSIILSRSYQMYVSFCERGFALLMHPLVEWRKSACMFPCLCWSISFFFFSSFILTLTIPICSQSRPKLGYFARGHKNFKSLSFSG